MEKVFIQSVSKPSLEYEVLALDQATQTATLQGQYDKFEITPFTKDHVAKLGYKLVKKPA